MSCVHVHVVLWLMYMCIWSTPPIVSNTYPKTVANKIFNFKKAISELSFDTSTSTMSCDCATSPYMYTPAKHVVTGNFTNKRVRKLLTKGPAYREQNNVIGIELKSYGSHC